MLGIEASALNVPFCVIFASRPCIGVSNKTAVNKCEQKNVLTSDCVKLSLNLMKFDAICIFPIHHHLPLRHSYLLCFLFQEIFGWKTKDD